MATPRDADAFAKRSLSRSVPEVLWASEHNQNFFPSAPNPQHRGAAVAMVKPAGYLVYGLRAAGKQQTSRWRRETARANGLQGKDGWALMSGLAIVAPPNR